MLPDYYLRDKRSEGAEETCKTCERYRTDTVMCYNCCRHPKNAI